MQTHYGSVVGRGVSFVFCFPIPLTFLILSAVSFNSCPNLAAYLITCCSVALFVGVLQAILACAVVILTCNFGEGPVYIGLIAEAIIDVINQSAQLGFAIWGTVILASSSCTQAGWPMYNYVVTAIFVSFQYCGCLSILILYLLRCIQIVCIGQ